jgi:hypothetical protein
MIRATCATRQIETNVLKMSKRRQTPRQTFKKKLKYFCENQGDVKVVAGSK